MFYRRKLPHWQPEPAPGVILFVTWRLAGSLPKQLGGEVGPLWLNDPRIAELVREALVSGEREREFYLLRKWVIMPNHVHVLVEPKVSLAKITHFLKGSTARKANQILGRTGNMFWQDEWFDRWIRSDDELHRLERYIEQNPVRAGLIEVAEDWHWSSAREE